MRYAKVLSQQVALAEDELAGRGVYEGKRAGGDRRQELEQQTRIWQALQARLYKQGFKEVQDSREQL